MPPADAVNPAWLAVPSADALPPAVASEIGPISAKIGFVPNVGRLLDHA
jgi:hypothetical protein